MDTNNLITAIATGFGLGISTLLFSTITFIPMSYVMNKFIYHAPAMRVILAIFAGAFSLMSLIVIIVKRLGGMEKVHYFGLLPVWMKTQDLEPTGWSAFLFKIFAVFTHPFMMFFLDGDIEPFKKMLEPMLVPKDTKSEQFDILGHEGKVKVYNGAVNETFSRAVRFASSIEKPRKWAEVMQGLQGAGTFIFDTDLMPSDLSVTASDSSDGSASAAASASGSAASDSSDGSAL